MNENPPMSVALFFEGKHNTGLFERVNRIVSRGSWRREWGMEPSSNLDRTSPVKVEIEHLLNFCYY